MAWRAGLPWKVLQILHGYISSNNCTQLEAPIDIAREHEALVINGHDHQITLPLPGQGLCPDRWRGVTSKLATATTACPLVRTPCGSTLCEAGCQRPCHLAISYNSLSVEYHARDVLIKGADYYRVRNDTQPRNTDCR